MPTTLPGAQLPAPALPGSQPQPTPLALPAWWNEPTSVIVRVLAIAEYDPQAAGEIWHEFKLLTGK